MADRDQQRQVVYRIKIAGDLARQDVEALELEIRRLASRTGVDITAVRIERVDGDI